MNHYGFLGLYDKHIPGRPPKITMDVQKHIDEYLQTSPTKNYRSRTLQLTPALYNVLLAHRQLHLELQVENDYVFTYQGNRIKTDIRDSFRTVLKKAGLMGVTLHTLRHTFASQLVMAGVALKEVQELMEHQSFETTLQYAHLSEDHVKKQVLKLPFANG